MDDVQTSVGRCFRHTLPSRLHAVDECCRLTEIHLSECGLSTHAFSVLLLMREALNNAVLHGNGIDSDRVVRVRVYCGKRWITLHVEDEGEGFDWKTGLGRVGGETDTDGRGLALYRLYAEKILFNARGNSVVLWLSRKEE